MATTFVLNGRTWTYPDDFIGPDGYAFADNWSDFFSDLSAELQRTRGAGLTSSTAITPATGEQVFTTGQTATEVVIPANALLIVEDAQNASKRMVGTVTSFSGTTLTLNITSASDGGDSPSEGSDWIIYYPSSTPIETLTALGSLASDDAFLVLDASAGANKKVLYSTLAALFIAAGGGTLTGDLDFNGNKAQNAEMEGERWGGTDLGTVSTDQTLSQSDRYEIEMELEGDIEITMSEPAAGTGYGKLIEIVQGSGGAHTPSIVQPGSPTEEFTWVGTAVDWPNRAEGDWDLLSVVLTRTGRRLVSHVKGS